MAEEAPKKKESKKRNGAAVTEKNTGQNATAQGGSAINTAVFVQNCTQVIYLLFINLIN